MRKTFFLLSIICATCIARGELPVKQIRINQGLSNNYIHGIAQDKRGYMWFSTRSGLNRFDGNSFRVFKKEEGNLNTITSNELNQVYADKFSPVIWIATERSGLSAFDYLKNTFTHYRYAQNIPWGLSADGITGMDNDPKGNLWISTYLAGIDYLDKKTQHFTHYDMSNTKGLVSNYTWCVKDDLHGRIYIGHVNNGLSVLDPKKRTAVNYPYTPNNPNGLPSPQILTIFIDSQNRVWIGTSRGLALFDPGTKKFTTIRNKVYTPENLSIAAAVKPRIGKTSATWCAQQATMASVEVVPPAPVRAPAEAV